MIIGVITSHSVLFFQPVFDEHIKNNSLAINADESIAIASKSDSNEIVIYDLENAKVFAKLDIFISPRNILFSPDGERVYISDSSMGGIEYFSVI